MVSQINYVIDGYLSTNQETETSNNSSFKNEMIVEFNDIESINRLVYSVRQVGVPRKGFPLAFKIYSSLIS